MDTRSNRAKEWLMLEMAPLRATAKQSADNPRAIRIIDRKSLLITS
ncbi:hypothetical protein ACFLUH_00825 [Chloroflexota bacterium]